MYMKFKDNDSTVINMRNVDCISRKYNEENYKRYVEIVMNSGIIIQMYYTDVVTMIRDFVEARHFLGNINEQ